MEIHSSGRSHSGQVDIQLLRPETPEPCSIEEWQSLVAGKAPAAADKVLSVQHSNSTGYQGTRETLRSGACDKYGVHLQLSTRWQRASRKVEKRGVHGSAELFVGLDEVDTFFPSANFVFELG